MSPKKDKVIPDYKQFLRLDKHTKIQDKIIILLRPKKQKYNNQMYLKMRKIREKIAFWGLKNENTIWDLKISNIVDKIVFWWLRYFFFEASKLRKI